MDRRKEERLVGRGLKGAGVVEQTDDGGREESRLVPGWDGGEQFLTSHPNPDSPSYVKADLHKQKKKNWVQLG